MQRSDLSASPAAPMESHQTPLPSPRSGAQSPAPATIVHADKASFKQVVQMLTGSADTAARQSSNPISSPPTIAAGKVHGGPKRQPFKLYERRAGSMKHLNMIPFVPAAGGGHSVSPRKLPEILSPNSLDLRCSLVLSPVTPLIADPFNRSPTTMARDGEPPKLLPLFPVTSPGASSSSSSSLP